MEDHCDKEKVDIVSLSFESSGSLPVGYIMERENGASSATFRNSSHSLLSQYPQPKASIGIKKTYMDVAILQLACLAC